MHNTLHNLGTELHDEHVLILLFMRKYSSFKHSLPVNGEARPFNVPKCTSLISMHIKDVCDEGLIRKYASILLH